MTQQRGVVLDRDGGGNLMATVHPSSVLRAEDRREEAMAGLVADLRIAAEVLAG